MSLYVGQKVVRVTDPTIPNRSSIPDATLNAMGWSRPEEGEVVTIRTINVWPTWTALTFFEHDNSHLIGVQGKKIEPGFNSRHFRPIVEQKTDISVLTALLTPAKQTEDA